MSDKDKEFIRLQLLKLLAENPQRSQRELSKLMGIALGRVNYCLSGLIDKGYIKLENFRNSENRILYVYHLTPAGLDAKLKLTFQFLKRRLEEYTRIK
ncbi:MarR family EPS-associated transcriptional regulator, partial [Desulfobacter latus]